MQLLGILLVVVAPTIAVVAIVVFIANGVAAIFGGD
jgi:hypothetical protein